jgi:hypothetical protein
MANDPKPIPQRSGKQSLSRGRADHRELGHVQPNRSRRRTLTNHDIDLGILHRGIQNLFYRSAQSVNLVDK